MNELSRIFADIRDGETVTLDKNRVYDVRCEDSFYKSGYYCSNTAKKHENPDGSRYAAIFLKDKKNIVIDGNGATILVHGKMTPLLFDNCENVTVCNLAIDYACPTMSEFTVVSNDGESIVIRINPECLFTVDGNELIWHGEENPDGGYYWEDSAHGNRRHVKLYDPETRQTDDFSRDEMVFDAIEIIGEHTLRLYPKNKNADFRKGCVYQTRNIVRDQTGSLFQRCADLTFENMRIMFMHGLGIVSQFCENVTFRNCDLTPKEGRTVASTADFFQFSGCKGQLTVENCKAWGAHDDYINVHGTHLRIVEINENEKSLTVRFMHPETWGMQAFEKGDRLEYIRWDTLIPYGETVVESFEKLDDTDVKLFVSVIPDGIAVGKDVVENATWTPDLHVSGCDFGPTSGRGILCTTRGRVIIESNRFTNLWGPALLLEDDCNFWFESGYSKEVIFRKNTVISCDHGTTYPGAPVIRYTPKIMDKSFRGYVHGKLILENNTFKNPIGEKHIFWLEYLKEAEIKNNSFDADFEIKAKNVGSIMNENNTVKGNF